MSDLRNGVITSDGTIPMIPGSSAYTDTGISQSGYNGYRYLIFTIPGTLGHYPEYFLRDQRCPYCFAGSDLFPLQFIADMIHRGIKLR
ncbi:MAG: hypothetical protein J6Y89_00315 [Lachnospiraceae bacterium]|nr:hypothetical protein [Lachnospiraceae bacterium]